MINRLFRFFAFLIIICTVGCGEKKQTTDELAPNLVEAESNDDQANAQSVKNGTIVSGFINKPMDQDWYKISIPPDSNAILNAELTGIENINIKMELFDEENEELLEIDKNKEGEAETLTNYELKPGNFYIRVRELWLKNKEKKFNDTLAYHLRIHLHKITPDVELESNNKAINATLLQPAIQMKGFISPYRDVDWFKLTTADQSDKYLNLTLSGLENVNLKLKVYDPIEALIDEADRGKKGDQETIVNLGIDAANDFYYIVVEGDNWQTNEIAPYQLSAHFIEMKHKMEFEPNDRLVKATEFVERDSIFGFIDSPDDEDWYQIKRDVIESQIARVELKGVARVDFRLTLTNELEEPILTINETGEQENERITNVGLLGSEKYYIKVESANKAFNDNEPYALFLQLRPYFAGEEFEFNNQKETANLIEVEKAIAGYIHPVGDVDFYRLELPHRYSRKLEIILEGILKVNTDMILYDDSMNEINRAAAKPEEGIERMTFDASPGTYYIKVFDNDGKESNYRDKYKLAIFLKQTG